MLTFSSSQVCEVFSKSLPWSFTKMRDPSSKGIVFITSVDGTIKGQERGSTTLLTSLAKGLGLHMVRVPSLSILLYPGEVPGGPGNPGRPGGPGGPGGPTGPFTVLPLGP